MRTRQRQDTRKHAAWDLGIVNAAFVQLWGPDHTRKSFKAMCGIRNVPPEYENNTSPTCRACRALVAEYHNQRRYTQ